MKRIAFANKEKYVTIKVYNKSDIDKYKNEQTEREGFEKLNKQPPIASIDSHFRTHLFPLSKEAKDLASLRENIPKSQLALLYVGNNKGVEEIIGTEIAFAGIWLDDALRELISSRLYDLDEFMNNYKKKGGKADKTMHLEKLASENEELPGKIVNDFMKYVKSLEKNYFGQKKKNKIGAPPEHYG